MIYASTVAELLGDESRWTKGAFVRDEYERTMTDCQSVQEAVESEAACKWCLSGALMKIYKIASAEYFEAMKKVLDVIQGDGEFISCTYLITFNDTKTYAEIIAVVRKAGV